MTLHTTSLPTCPATGVLVVIPTLNEAGTIETVIAELSQGLPAQRSVRFVVVDGGSIDGTQSIVRRIGAGRPGVHLMHNPKKLQSAAVNMAVQAHGNDAGLLVRCDAHAHYPPGYIAQLVESLEQHGADSVVVSMDTVGDTCTRRAIAWVSNSRVGTGGSAHRGGQRSGWVDHGHHAAFRMESFVRAGGYDETFSHNEDAELDCRQRALGSRIYLDATIRLRYLPRPTLAALWRQYAHYGRGRSRTARKHPGSLRPRQLAVPAHVAACVAALMMAPWWPLLLSWPLLYLATLASTSVAVAVAHRSACGLLAGPAAGVMHMAWAVGFLCGWLTVPEKRWEPHAASALTVRRQGRAQ